MRKIRHLLSMFLTIAMAVSLLDVTAFGLRLKLDDATFDLQISSDEGKVPFLATYDAETGQMRSVSRNGFLSWEKGTVLQSMMVDGDSYAPIDWAVRSYIDQDGRRTIDFENDHSRRYDLVGTGTVYLTRVNDCDVTLNGVQIGGAHVFGYEQPYGVYIQSLNGTVDADDMSVTLYAGQWDEDNRVTVFDKPVNPGVFDKSDKEDGTGVHLTVKDENANRNWIDDPYQVKLELTFTGTNGKTATVVYDTLWYKEGQMGVADFAARVREKVGDSWAGVTEADKDRVKNGWSEEDYNDRLDDFAFAVTRGNLTQPDENNNWNTDATHYRNALDDVRYGTAKTILESVYAAAWNDSTHTALPDSVKLIDDQGKEWHGDNDTLPHREIDRIIDALLEALPQKESAVSKITIRKAADNWGYVLFDDADDTESNRVDANLRGMAFANNVTISLGEGMNDGWISFANCSFAQGATINAPAAGGYMTVNFNNSCTGAVTVVEAEADTVARAKLVTDKLTRDQESYDTFGRLFYEDALRIENADGMTLSTGGARVSVSAQNGGTVKMNGVDYSSNGKIDLHTYYSPVWQYDDNQKQDVLTSYHKSILAIGEDYKHDDQMENGSLTRGLTVSGTTSDEFRIRGIVDVAELTLGENATLCADFDPNNWSNVYVTLGEGQTLYANNDWGLELYVNGERTDRPTANRDDRDVRIDTPAGFVASVWQWRDDEDPAGWRDITNELESHENKDDKNVVVGYTFNNQENGYDREHDRWYPLNNDSINGTQVQLSKLDDDKLLYTVVFYPVPCEWERSCDLTDFGYSLRDRLEENGWGERFADYYEPFNDDALTGFYTAAMGRLAAVWPEKKWQEGDGVSVNDLWRGDHYDDRLALALVVDLLGTESVKANYNDPDNNILWGDAKTALTEALSKLGKSNAVFSDGGWLDENNVLHDAWHDDYGINQGGKNDLLDQFEDQLPQKESAVTTITVKRAADNWGYVLFGDDEDTETNRVDANLRGMAFTNNVTISLGADMNDAWVGFANCTFAQGATIHVPAAGHGLDVSFKGGTSAADGKTITVSGTGTDGDGTLHLNVEDAGNIALTTTSVRMDVDLNEGQGVTLNGVTYLASENGGFHLETDYEGNDDNRFLSVCVNGYDYWWDDDWQEHEGKPDNLDEALTISGTLTDTLRVGGVINVSELTVCAGGKLELSGERRSCVTLGENTISVYDNADGDLYFVGSGAVEVDSSFAELEVNGVVICAGIDYEDDEGFNLRISNAIISDSSFTVSYAGSGSTIDPNQIRHDVDGYTGVWFDWDGFDEGFDYDDLTLTVTAGDTTVTYTRIPREWDRSCDLTDFGYSLRERLEQNGWRERFAGYYEPFNGDALTGFYTDAMGRLADVWPKQEWLENDEISEDDLWRGGNYEDRLALALVVDMLGADYVKAHYDDPDRRIMWGDAKAALTEVLQTLKNDETINSSVFNDHGWQNDEDLTQGGKDDLLDQFERNLIQVTSVKDLVAALSKNERALVTGNLTLNADELDGLEGSALTGNATDGYTLTVPAGVELFVDEGATLTVGEGVTLAIAGRLTNEGTTSVNGAVVVEKNEAANGGDGASFENSGNLTVTSADGLTIGKDGYFWCNGGVSAGVGAVTFEDGSNGYFCGEADGEASVTFNGLTFTPGNGEAAVSVSRESGDAGYRLIVSNENENDLTITGSGWANQLILFGYVDASGVEIAKDTEEKPIGAVILKTAFAGNENELRSALVSIDIDNGVSDVIIVDDIELKADLTIPECYLQIAEGKTLTVPSGITVTFQDGYALDQDGNTVESVSKTDLPNLLWKPDFNGIGLRVPNTGGVMEVNGALTVNGTLSLGTCVGLSNNGTVTVNGTLTMAQGSYRYEGYWEKDEETGEANPVIWHMDSRGDNDWFCVTDGAILNNNGGTLTVAEGRTVEIGDYGKFGNWYDDGRVEISGSMTAAAYAVIENDASFRVAGSLTMNDADFRNNENATLTIPGAMTLNDVEGNRWSPYLSSRGNVEVGGTLTLGNGAVMENDAWFDEWADGMRFAITTVSKGGEIVNNGKIENRSVLNLEDDADGVNGSGTLLHIAVQDEQDGGYTALVLEKPSGVTCNVEFYAIVRDAAGLSQVIEQNGDFTKPRVAVCEIDRDITYAPETKQSLDLDELIINDDRDGFTLTLGNVALTVDRLEIRGALELRQDAALTVSEDGECVVSGSVENEGTWYQNGKLTLDNGEFDQYIADTDTFKLGESATLDIERGLIYAIVREDSKEDPETGALTGQGTIKKSPAALIEAVKSKAGESANVKTMAFVLTSGGIEAASTQKYDVCLLVRQFDPASVLTGDVSFQMMLLNGATLTLSDSASLTAGMLYGEGTIIVQTQDQVICNTEKISENIKIETQAPMSAAGG